jgi:hypothetical protein
MGMSEKNERRAFLIGTAVGYTCLALSLLAYLVEGGLVARGWIPERSVNAFGFLSTALLSFFPASLAYSRMLFVRRSDNTPEQEAEPRRVGRLVTRTVLLTLAVALIIEISTVGTDAFWHYVSHTAP